jgi:hypothetical protein
MRCTICENTARRAEIDVSLCRGMSYARVAKRYSKPGEPKVSVGAVGRHARHHLPSQLRSRIAARALGGSTEMTLTELKNSESDSLLKNLLANRVRYGAIQSRALDAGDLDAEIAAGKAIDRNLTITGRLVGDLTQHATTVNNSVFITASWFRIRSAILAALRPPAFRPAREAVAKALLAIEAQPQGAEQSQVAIDFDKPQAIDTTAVEVK